MFNRSISLKALDLAKVFGFLFPRECLAMQTLAWSVQQPNPVFVNIGAGAGTSGLALKEARPDARVITVDISEGGPNGGMENEVNAFKAAPEFELPIQVLGDSHEMGKQWGAKSGKVKREYFSGPIDLLFIDADHSYAGCKGDQEAWLKHVRPGGLVLWHDYRGEFWPDVKKAVDEVDWPTVIWVDSLIAKRKPNE